MDNKTMRTHARELRKNMTREERKLWSDYLHTYSHRFRRQVTMGNYILDFYCAAAKLAVELDGSQHYKPEGMEYDRLRTAYLEGLGICVLRFANTDVKYNLRGVCDQIDLVVGQRLTDLSRQP